MKEKVDALYDELFDCLKEVAVCVKHRTATSAEFTFIPEVARVLIDLIILQSKM